MDEYFRRVELGVTIDEFHRLPRNPAYKYEYFGGRAVLSPRPKACTCVRDLSPVEYSGDPPGVTLKLLPPAEVMGLVELFRWAAAGTQPFASLDDEDRLLMSAACVRRTAVGRDGPLIAPACLTAHDERDGMIGAVLVTLVAPEILTDPFAGEWRAPPPADAVEQKLGVPHLTWVLVNPWHQRQGVGTVLLGAAVRELAVLGFEQLASTFLLDNGPSGLWHWRNGFRLLPKWSVAMRRGREEVRPDR